MIDGEEYAVDMHSYGLKGYTIQIVDSKIIVSGGSEESMLIAINKIFVVYLVKIHLILPRKHDNVYVFGLCSCLSQLTLNIPFFVF